MQNKCIKVRPSKKARLEGAVWVSGNIPNRLKETVGMEKPYQGQRLEKTRPFNLVHKFHISYDTTKD